MGMVHLKTSSGVATLTPLEPGRSLLTVQPTDGPAPLLDRCETTYSRVAVQRILDVKGLPLVCDEISREEDPQRVRLELRFGVLGFVPQAWFIGKRVLDFGCGSGSSTILLRELLPDSHLVGVDMDAELVELARDRSMYRGVRIEYHVSPNTHAMPAALGRFDAIILSAVYEHLLPDERGPLLRLLWAALEPGGYLFLNQTPFRWFPYEHHTSQLWGINYLPKPVAAPIVRRFAQRDFASLDWQSLLRIGLRGATQREILRRLRSLDDGTPIVVKPILPGVRDHADLWLAYTSEKSISNKKRAAHLLFKAAERATGQPVVQSLMLAFRKDVSHAS